MCLFKRGHFDGMPRSKLLNIFVCVFVGKRRRMLDWVISTMAQTVNTTNRWMLRLPKWFSIRITTKNFSTIILLSFSWVNRLTLPNTFGPPVCHKCLMWSMNLFRWRDGHSNCIMCHDRCATNRIWHCGNTIWMRLMKRNANRFLQRTLLMECQTASPTHKFVHQLWRTTTGTSKYYGHSK